MSYISKCSRFAKDPIFDGQSGTDSEREFWAHHSLPVKSLINNLFLSHTGRCGSSVSHHTIFGFVSASVLFHLGIGAISGFIGAISILIWHRYWFDFDLGIAVSQFDFVSDIVAILILIVTSLLFCFCLWQRCWFYFDLGIAVSLTSLPASL